MKEFLNTLMIGNWVEYDGVRIRVDAGMLRALYYSDNEEYSQTNIKPILLTRDMIEHNGWRLVLAFNEEDVYGKRVQEGKDNDEYIVGVYVSQNNEVCKVVVFKVMRQEHVEHRDFIGMLKHTRVHVHTFQNLLNLVGLKETSEEFSIM